MAAPERHSGPTPGPARRLGRAWQSLAAEQRLAAFAALALWGSMFLPWYGKSVTEAVRGSLRAASYTLSAFGAFSFVEAAVLLVATAVLVLLFARAERRAFHLPGGDGSVILAAGVWTSLLVFYRMLDKPRTTGNAQLTTTIGLQWGIFVAIGGAVVLAYAGTRMRAAHVPEPSSIEDPTLRPYRPSAATRRTDDEPTKVVTRRDRGAADPETEQLTFETGAPAEAGHRRTRPPEPDGRRERDPDLRRERDPDLRRERDPFGER